MVTTEQTSAVQNETVQPNQVEPQAQPAPVTTGTGDNKQASIGAIIDSALLQTNAEHNEQPAWQPKRGRGKGISKGSAIPSAAANQNQGVSPVPAIGETVQTRGFTLNEASIQAIAKAVIAGMNDLAVSTFELITRVKGHTPAVVSAVKDTVAMKPDTKEGMITVGTILGQKYQEKIQWTPEIAAIGLLTTWGGQMLGALKIILESEPTKTK